MNENTVKKGAEAGVAPQQLISALLRKAWLVAVVAVLCAALVFGITFCFVTPKYQSSAMFYVNSSTLSVGDVSVGLTTGDLSAAKSLVDSYIVILNTRASLNDVIDYAGVDRTYEEMKEMISAAAVNSTEIFEVVVTSPDPQEAEKIANAIAYILPKRISSIIEGTSAKVVDAAVVAAEPSSPSYLKTTLLGFIVGLVLSVSAVVLHTIFDVTIRTEDDVTNNCTCPVLAMVPDMAAPTREHSGKRRGRHMAGAAQTVKNENHVGENVSFAASEAYKLLRTKLQFSFADENDCHVIGVSSALAGEGKSTSAVNLAYTLAQLDKRVLLVECDLRRPSLSGKLGIEKVPGLSNYLTRLVSLEEIIQPCQLDESATFSVISSGRVPPNPIELLSSGRMAKAVTKLKASYDYIILDLPPVAEVSDALVAANLADGVLLVVRQNYCNRVALSATVRQFEFVNARILGVVMNCAVEETGVYGKKYYKHYYGNYAGSYASAHRHAKSRSLLNNDKPVEHED